MNRRQFLAVCGGGAAIGISGCRSRDPAGDAPADGTETAEPAGRTGTVDDSRYELVSFESSSERIEPDHRYTIDRRTLAESVEEDHSVVDVANLSADTRSALRQARNGSYSTGDLPDGTRSAVEEHDFVDFGPDDDGPPRYIEFRLFEIDLDSPPRLTVEASLLDHIVTSDDPASLEIVATNGGDETIRWQTGLPKPFGWQVADGLVLWTDAYKEVAAVEDGEIVGGSDAAVATELGPGETVAEEYEVQSGRDAFEPGEFTLDGELSYWFDGRWEAVSYEVGWEIRERDTGQ